MQSSSPGVARAVIAATKQRVKKGLAPCLAAVNDVVTAM